MAYLFLIIKGMLFGIANLIPGVSGGTMAVITGVYEKLLDSINNIFKKFKKSIIFLLIFGIGALIAVLVFSKLLKYSTEHFKVATYCLFIGLILGGIPALCKPVIKRFNILNIILLLIGFGIVLGLIFIPTGNPKIDNLVAKDYIMLFISGILASVAMVVPGISGMMMLEIFGYRELFTNTLSNLTKLSDFTTNIKVLIPIGLGIIVGLFSAAKLMGFLLKKYKIQTLFAIIGFVFASIIVLIIKMGTTKSIPEIVVAIILIPVGFILSYMLDYFSSKAKKEDEEENNSEYIAFNSNDGTDNIEIIENDKEDQNDS